MKKRALPFCGRMPGRWAWLLAFAFCLLALGACSSPGQGAGQASGSPSSSSADLSVASEPAGSQSQAQASSSGASASSKPVAPLTYPTGWLAVDEGGVPAGEPVRILSLPDIDVVAHRDGKVVGASDQDRASAQLPAVDAGQALVEYGGSYVAVNPGSLLVNLPDVLPTACYDIVYSYAATSRCAGEDIPGVTGERLPGYADGLQQSAYWADQRFVVPCAYRTACKAIQVEAALEAQGLRLLVFDAYRPMTAQYSLSDAFQTAFASNPVMQGSLGAWSLSWYVAPGASGHNFGTDLDVGACDGEGNPLPMPSDFDAFDETGHLTDMPIDSGAITPGAYRQAVLENDACLALHQAFVDAGFSELASEWWHFGDEETEWAMQSLVGPSGLDFVAEL